MTSHTISTLDELRSLYREPSARVQAKKTNRIGPETATILAQTPFVLLATSDQAGRCDVSPRGGPPGMVQTIDEHTVALPDLNGNNLVDSLSNIVDNPHAGLLVLTPGTDETVRIDGRATLSTDPEILGRWDGLIRRPKLAVVIEIEALFIHCAKAFRRSALWQPETWPTEVPDACALLLEHSGTDGEVAELRSFLEKDYASSLAEERPD